MTFKDVYKAVSNGNWKDLNKANMYACITRQEENVRQQREGLLRALFGSKRALSGRVAKVTSSEYERAKSAPYSGYVESDRILNKSKTVAGLHETLLLVQRRLGLVK